jgi:hypothetical protein
MDETDASVTKENRDSDDQLVFPRWRAPPKNGGFEDEKMFFPDDCTGSVCTPDHASPGGVCRR